MKHLQLVISVVFLAGGVFQVNAVVSDNDPATTAHQKKIFSETDPKSLGETLNFKAGVDIKDTFATIVVGLSKDQREDGIYYKVSDSLLWVLNRENIARRFVDAWMTVCYIVYQDRENRAKGKTMSVEDVITNSLKECYGKKLTEEISKTFHNLAPHIGQAMKGDIVAAANIVPDLANLFDDYPVLNKLGYSRKMDILEKATAMLHKW